VSARKPVVAGGESATNFLCNFKQKKRSGRESGLVLKREKLFGDTRPQGKEIGDLFLGWDEGHFLVYKGR